MQENKENVTAEFDSVFIKKIVKSRKSFIIWIPKDEAEYLKIDEETFVRVGLKKLKTKEKK
jgi:hypothetical protein